MIHVVAHLADEATLFGAEDIAGTAYVEVAHGDVEAAADGGELLDGTQAALGVVGQGEVGGDEQVAESLAVRASHAAAHLVQVAEAKLLRVVDDHRVGVGDVQAVLHDAGGHQHVDVALQEAHQRLLGLLAVHAAVGHRHPCVGHQTLHQARHLGQVLHAVADEEGLSATAHLVHDGVAYQLFAEVAQLGLDGLPVGRRGLYDAQVAGTHQRELQRARNGGGRQRQAVHTHLHLFQLLFHADTELLLLVDNQQSQVLELQFFVCNGVGADEDVYLAVGHVLVYLVLLLGGAEAVQVVDPHRHVLQAFAEGVVVLEGQHRAGHQHSHLLRVAAGLEGGAYGHFGLAEAHVAAHQTVHRRLLLHVVFHGHRGFQLVGRVLVEEAGFQLFLHRTVGAEGEASRGLALGVEGYEVLGDVLHLPLGLLLEHLPGVAAQPVQLRRLALLAHVAADFVQPVDADVQDVVVLVYQSYQLLALAVLRHLLQAAEAPHTIVDVGHIVARLQLEQLLEGHGLVGRPQVLHRVLVVALENLVVGEAQHTLVVVDEAVT